MEDSTNIIEINNLYKSYETNRVLNNITLHVASGDIYGIIGKSGTGKSTLLNCINGLEDIDEGDILINDKNVSKMSYNAVKLLRKEIGMIFQSFNLIKRKTVFENIALPMKIWGEKKEKINARVFDLARLVGVEDKLNQYPSQLSGGQKQRVGIARALINNPKILLSDEATSALDPDTTTSILDLLRDINEATGITILLVTHEIEVIKSICNKVSIMENGKIIESSDTIDLFMENPQSLQTFMGYSQKSSLIDDRADFIVVFKKYSSESKKFFQRFSEELSIEFLIEMANTEMINGIETAKFHFSVKNSDKDSAISYLNKKNLNWRLVNGA